MKRTFETQEDRKLYLARCDHLSDLKQLLSPVPSIVSNNCLAGRMYQDMESPYLSPTVGLYFFFPDYVEFLSDLDKNINADLIFTESSKYELGRRRISGEKRKYPVALLDGRIEIHFLHYLSQEEAREKWERRCSRLNLGNLLILACERDLCTEEDIMRFDALPFDRKIFFTAKRYEYRSTVFLEDFVKEGTVGDPRTNGALLYGKIVEHMRQGSVN